jgi:protein O-GlcNAc transferase
MNKDLAAARQFLQEDRFLDAADCCRRAIKRRSDIPAAKKLLAEALFRLGLMHFRHSGLLDEAQQNFQAALESDPGHLDALINQGALLSGSGRFDDAIALYRRGLRIAPRNAAFLEYLAKTQILAEKLDDASTTLHELARAAPANAAACLLRDALLVHKVAPDAAYIEHIRKTALEKLAAIATQDLALASPLHFPVTYFPFSYHGLNDRELVQRLARAYLKAAPSLAWQAPHVALWRAPAGRIRIGIASHFFFSHSIGNTSRGLVEKLDRAKFEVVLIRLGAGTNDDMAARIDRSADRVVTVPGHDLQTARETIAAQELDILFYQDIGMEPLSYFLAFARLAPAQLTSFGHPDTTGIPNLDYFLSSEYYEPAEGPSHYSEKLVTLPAAGTLAYYHRPARPLADTAGARANFGFASCDRLYVCPQTLFKIHPDMDRLFHDILRADPAAKVVLIEPATGALRKLLEKRFAALDGMDMQRLVFLKSLPYAGFLSLLQCADVMLDTLHFNGQNTSLEAFAMGTPVVTLPGTMQRGRHTFGMYQAMAWTELVARDGDDYVRLAVRVASLT